MTQKLRIAVVGCGYFAQNHLHAWRQLAGAGAELAAVCDTDQTRAASAAKAFDVPAFSSVDEMLDIVRPDVVDIATRMDTHKSLCIEMARRGVSCIVQKPLAPSWEDCKAIAGAVSHYATFLAVHENFRFQTSMVRVKDIIASGEIGAPSWGRISFRTGYDVYRNQPYFYNEERLVILDLGIHLLDLARFFFGEATRVSCETQRRNPKVKAEDTASMIVRHQSGAVSTIDCSYEARRVPDHFPKTLVEIEGPSGSIILTADSSLRVTSQGKMRMENAETPLLPWSDTQFHVVQESVQNANAHFLACLQKGKRASTDIQDNVKTLALVEAAYLSAETGKACEPSQWESTL